MGLRVLERPNHHRISCLTDQNALAGVLDDVRPDFVFHLAGTSFATDPSEYYRINTEYATALLAAFTLAGLTDLPLLLMGTSAEYGLVDDHELPLREGHRPRPYNHYGISKLAQTLEGLAYHGRTKGAIVLVRPFNLIGPGMPSHLALQNFALQIAGFRRTGSAPIIEAGRLDSMRDFVDVEDAVALLWDLVRTPQAYGQIVNVCSGKATSIGELLHGLIAISGLPVLVQAAAEREKPIDIPIHFGDPQKLFSLVGWVPRADVSGTLRQILEETERL